MGKKRDALKSAKRDPLEQPEPHDVWDAAVTGLDIVLVIHELEWCLNKRRMSLQQADEHLNGLVYVTDVQHFIRVEQMDKNHIKVFYKYDGVQVGFECALSGLSQFRKDIQKSRERDHDKEKQNKR